MTRRTAGESRRERGDGHRATELRVAAAVAV
jgi:hypothetical protein